MVVSTDKTYVNNCKKFNLKGAGIPENTLKQDKKVSKPNNDVNIAEAIAKLKILSTPPKN
ncbi:unnamed protein product, partial [Rotaria magnacalcarata]